MVPFARGKTIESYGAVIGSIPQDLSFDPKASSLLQGNSGVGKDIPPFSIAIGKDGIAALNIIGLRRAGFGPALRKEMKSAFDLLYGNGLNVKQALEEAEKRTWLTENDDVLEFRNDIETRYLPTEAVERSQERRTVMLYEFHPETVSPARIRRRAQG